jgi:thioredoxin
VGGNDVDLGGVLKTIGDNASYGAILRGAIQSEENMSELVHLTDQNFELEVLQSETPVLVDFWAEWCAPCRMVAPVVEAINVDYDGKIKVAKMDVDASPVIPAQLGVMSIPTLILFLAGKPIQRMVGFQPKPSLKIKIDEALAIA